MSVSAARLCARPRAKSAFRTRAFVELRVVVHVLDAPHLIELEMPVAFTLRSPLLAAFCFLLLVQQAPWVARLLTARLFDFEEEPLVGFRRSPPTGEGLFSARATQIRPIDYFIYFTYARAMNEALNMPFLLDAADAENARRCAKRLLSVTAGEARLQIEDADSSAESLVLPDAALRLLIEILQRLGRGDAVVCLPLIAELTTRQAAEVLAVSRPHLVKRLLDTGEIPYRRVGTHRRVKLSDVLRYQEKRRLEEEKAFEEMVAASEALGVGYP